MGEIMNFLFNSIFDFIYIAAIILGGITLSLTIIMNAKERDKKHKAMLLFIGAIFVYMIVVHFALLFGGEHVFLLLNLHLNGQIAAGGAVELGDSWFSSK